MYARKNGVILNISSISAKAAYGWGSAYAAAKAGMLGLTRVNAAEAARKGVTRERNMSWAVTETVMSKDFGRGTGAEIERSEKDQLADFSNRYFRAEAKRRTNCACGAVSVFRPGERDNWTGDQRRRRGRIFLERRPSGGG